MGIIRGVRPLTAGFDPADTEPRWRRSRYNRSPVGQWFDESFFPAQGDRETGAGTIVEGARTVTYQVKVSGASNTRRWDGTTGEGQQPYPGRDALLSVALWTDTVQAVPVPIVTYDETTGGEPSQSTNFVRDAFSRTWPEGPFPALTIAGFDPAWAYLQALSSEEAVSDMALSAPGEYYPGWTIVPWALRVEYLDAEFSAGQGLPWETVQSATDRGWWFFGRPLSMSAVKTRAYPLRVRQRDDGLVSGVGRGRAVSSVQGSLRQRGYR